MKTTIIDMMPRIARTEAERYAKCSNLSRADKAIMKAYRSIAHGGRIIDLQKTFRAGGVNAQGMPKLAICRADSSRVELNFYTSILRFYGDTGNYDKRTINVPNFTSIREGRTWASLPHIPPYARRRNLGRFFLLWEATWHGRPSGDPFLLDRIDDNMFRIVTAWDITPVEAAAITY